MPNTKSQNITNPTPFPHTLNSQSVYLCKTAKICRHTKHIVSRLLPSFPAGIQTKCVLRPSRHQIPFRLPFIKLRGFGRGDPYYTVKLRAHNLRYCCIWSTSVFCWSNCKEFLQCCWFCFRFSFLSSICLTEKDKVHIRFVCIF